MMYMPLYEILKYLHKDNIMDMDVISIEHINIHSNSLYKEDNFIDIEIGQDVHCTINFTILLNWDIVNSLGDGYYTQSFDYVDAIKADIYDLTINDIPILDNSVYYNRLRQWVENVIIN